MMAMHAYIITLMESVIFAHLRIQSLTYHYLLWNWSSADVYIQRNDKYPFRNLLNVKL